jgi:hypothetical protein
MKVRRRGWQLPWSALAVIVVATLAGLAQSAGDPIQRGFLNPPDSAKPRVWWHWMNGNVSKEGIKADLEWMKRAGIGGFLPEHRRRRQRPPRDEWRSEASRSVVCRRRSGGLPTA